MSSDPRRLVVGVDVDGVLADQITGILPRIRERYDLALTRSEITEWNLPIRNSDIGQELERCMAIREFVLGMPVHDGAASMLAFLRETNRVIVVTARKGPALEWTAEWLCRNGLPYDELIGGAEAKKSACAADVLIDDYIGNIVEFLDNTSGCAVLVDQPWNRDRSALLPLAANGRLVFLPHLSDLRDRWPRIVSAEGNSERRRGGIE
jgi:uncharacterized HAD superfamily protein